MPITDTAVAPDTPTAAATAPAVSPAGARMTPRAKLILLLLCGAQFIIALDFSILNVALPVLGRDLGMGQADLQWAVTAFALPSGGFLLLSGRIADLYGRRRLFLIGLGLFTAASVLTALAWSPAAFLAGRALQGLGAAVIVPTGMSLLTTTFAEGPQRERALGISGTVLSMGFTIGMVLGGVMTDALGWRSTMGLLSVAGVAVLAAAPLLLTESRPPERPRIDVPGAVTVTGGLLSLIYALSTAAEQGFGRPDVLVTLIVGAGLLAAFVRVESRAEQPLVSLPMLRRRTVAWGNLAGLMTFAMMSAVIFLLTLYLQEVLRLSAFHTGLVFGVQGVVSAGAGLVAPKVIGRLGARRTLLTGLLLQAGFTAALLGLGTGTGMWLALTGVTLASLGHLWAIIAYGVTATSGVPDAEQGLATGLVTSSQQVGLTVGIPLLSAVASAHIAALRADGSGFAEATLGGIKLGLGLDAALVAVVALLVAAGLRTTRRR
ncbi:MFS transporter [Streptomyces nigrescens]|uniref:MFS transporter n=1 Tax=Streptomyces nigrescens TaxID=1920 RepID=A0A640TRD0_STRNI|nr:MFS transporter [Streptomyces libani]WAT99084.1 MFS transporter [Streptomyces libani subsp. libani]GFE24776.1 MFS transporter [Streptomyces libani subsp. libani]GGV95279.1 MFS transporter [Streptomyces libani subsp. libani]